MESEILLIWQVKRRRKLASNVRSLNELSKILKIYQFWLMNSWHIGELPICMQIKRSTERRSLLKSAKHAQIKVLSNVLIKTGQTKKTIHSNSENLSKSVKQSAHQPNSSIVIINLNKYDTSLKCGC